MIDTKKCSKCGLPKPVAEFYHRHGRCKACKNAYMVEYNSRHRDKVASVSRRMALRRKYNLTPAGFDAMLASQGGRCAICRTDTPRGQGRFHVDHDHGCCPGHRSCGRCIRGLLCNACNIGMGSFQDNIDSLLAAISYLRLRSTGQ